MYDILFRDFFDAVYPYISDRICDAHNFDCFGNAKGAEEQYDMANDMYYMYTYALVAYNEQQLLFKNLYPTSPDDCPDKVGVMNKIWDHFNFECKVDYFKCKHGMDLSEILRRVFGIGTHIGKGIDFMRIENNDDCIPPFKIV